MVKIDVSLKKNDFVFLCIRVPGWNQIRPDIRHDLDQNCLQMLSSYILPYHNLNIYIHC